MRAAFDPRKKLLTALGLLTALTSASCYPYHPTLEPFDQRFQKGSEALDKLKWYVDAYGSAAMSPPLLVQPDDSFKFNLTGVSADSFFTAEKGEISGRVAGSVEAAQIAGLNLQAALDPAAAQQQATALAEFQRNQGLVTQRDRLLYDAAVQLHRAAVQAAMAQEDPAKRAQALNDAYATLQKNLSGISATFPRTQGPTLPTVPAIPNTAASLLSTQAALQSLYADKTPGVSGDTRTALLMAAGDTATNAILSLLGDPTKMTKLKGKRVLFGVSMVSVNPGWKTKQGYSVDISSHVDFRWVRARAEVRTAFMAQKSDNALEQAALQQLQSCVATSMPANEPVFDVYAKTKGPAAPYNATQFTPYVVQKEDDDIKNPQVAAVSPMADGQSLDLQASTRRQSEMALQMAFALYSAGMSAQAAAFESFAKRRQLDIETRTNNVVVNAYSEGEGSFGFRVLPRIAANPENGNASTSLGPSSFPTLLIIATDDVELRPRVVVTKTAAGDTQCYVAEREIQIFTTPRWVPLDQPCLRIAPVSKPCVGETLTEEERVQVLGEVAHTVDHLPKADNDQKEIALLVQRRAFLLKKAFNGTLTNIPLPLDFLVTAAAAGPQPSVDSIGPGEITLERDPATGGFLPRVVKMVLAGKDLDKIDLTTIKVPVGSVDWLKTEKVGDLRNPQTPNASLAGNAIQLLFQVNTEGPIVFKLTVKNGSGSILSLPLIVRRPVDHYIARSWTKEKDGTPTDTIRFSDQVPADVIKSEIEKNKEHYPSQAADVKVRVKTETLQCAAGGPCPGANVSGTDAPAGGGAKAGGAGNGANKGAQPPKPTQGPAAPAGGGNAKNPTKGSGAPTNPPQTN